MHGARTQPKGARIHGEFAIAIAQYKGLQLHCGYRLDLFVADLVIVEIKSVAELAPIHTAQLLTYMKLKSAPAGLLINFNVPVLRQGVKRLLNKDHEIVHQRRFS